MTCFALILFPSCAYVCQWVTNGTPVEHNNNRFITRKQFDQRIERLQSAMETEALRLMGSTDIISDVYAMALAAWTENRYRDPDPTTGIPPDSAFARWIYTILHRAAISQKRAEKSRQRHEGISLNGDSISIVQARWEAFKLSLERNKVQDLELRHEAICRMKLADLDEEERICLSMRLHGKRGHEIAQKINASQATVTRRIQTAVEKLKRVPDSLVTTPDVDMYIWRIGCEVVIYTPPVRTGSALDRERMQLSDAEFQRYGKRE